MSVAEFLAELRRHDIQVWAEGGQLRCNAPAGALVADLREQLRQRKAEILEFLQAAEARGRQQRAIVPLQPHGGRAAIFAIAGHNGDVFAYRALAQRLGDDQPFFGLQPPGLDSQSEPFTSVEKLAAYFAAQIRAFRPDGPLVIAGFCAGGTIAFELACQLQQHGTAISFVALFGSPYPGWYRFLPQLRHRIVQQALRVARHVHTLAMLSGTTDLRRYIADKLHQRKAKREAEREAERLAMADPVMVRRAKVEAATLLAIRRYTPARFAGRIGLFLPNKAWPRSDGWQRAARDSEEYFGPDACDGDTMLREPHVAAFAELFRRCRDSSEKMVGGADDSKTVPTAGNPVPPAFTGGPAAPAKDPVSSVS